ncbi:MAG: TnpV protein [Ruminococcus sp.]|nr:TnpV protein [Ruminococcus sp.]
MEITYTMQGDYLLPSLTLPEQKNKEIGIWGQRHKRYLLNHHKVKYYNLLTSCKLIDYLADINEQAENMYQLLVKQLTEKEGVTEQLKAENPMLWVKKMNSIQHRVREIVNTEIIFR